MTELTKVKQLMIFICLCHEFFIFFLDHFRLMLTSKNILLWYSRSKVHMQNRKKKMPRTQRAALATAEHAKRLRTCCNFWHIKYGIIILGLIELIAVSLLISGILTKIINDCCKLNCGIDFTKMYYLFIFFLQFLN